MSKNLELKSISEILDKDFFIPSYQRGYRWGEQQVTDLLNDINEFTNKTKQKDEFYCLQPIVIRYDKDNKYYKVIDGQQRLTTIYIILKYLQESSEKFAELKKAINNNEEYKTVLEFCDIEDFKVEPPYKIAYETRKNDKYDSKKFLENKLSNEISYDNPDFYYISQAYHTIKEWFKKTPKKLFHDTLVKETKVIWYEVHCENDKEEIEIFTRLNIGKIQLTNAELIKALFLLAIEDYKEQIEFSSIWDNIEQTLQKNDFWYFLSNSIKSETAIDLIFEVLAQKYQEKYNKSKKDEEKLNFKLTDDKYAYYIFANVLKQKFKTEKEIWQEAQEIYRYFLNWYNDREMYHKVGYLIHFKMPLLDLLKEYENKTRDCFKDSLDELIQKGEIQNINLMNLNYGGKGIHKVLLLFNLETILQNKNSNARFDFFHFKYINQKNKIKKRGWDIEHIASQTDNTNKEEWIKAVYKYIANKEINDEKIKKIERQFERFYSLVKKMLNIKEIDEKNKDNIGNLTLLDSKTNRSYGNAFFPIKRAVIIDEDSKGNFIPIGTKNVFLKRYSKKLSDMMNWNDEDIENYRDEIFIILEKYNINYWCEIKGENNE
jgi:uncharacterized protein with ParB-like and HNH nuclease domain